MRILLIAIFGAVGTLARYGLQGVVQVRTGGTFPYGTLLVNLTGCFLLGLIAQFTMNHMVIPPDWRVAISVGFFGGYTTFSSFGWETAKMMEDGEWPRASAYGLRRNTDSRPTVRFPPDQALARDVIGARRIHFDDRLPALATRPQLSGQPWSQARV